MTYIRRGLALSFLSLVLFSSSIQALSFNENQHRRLIWAQGVGQTFLVAPALIGLSIDAANRVHDARHFLQGLKSSSGRDDAISDLKLSEGFLWFAMVSSWFELGAGAWQLKYWKAAKSKSIAIGEIISVATIFASTWSGSWAVAQVNNICSGDSAESCDLSNDQQQHYDDLVKKAKIKSWRGVSLVTTRVVGAAWDLLSLYSAYRIMCLNEDTAAEADQSGESSESTSRTSVSSLAVSVKTAQQNSQRNPEDIAVAEPAELGKLTGQGTAQVVVVPAHKVQTVTAQQAAEDALVDVELGDRQ